MDVRSEPGVIPKREPFTMSMHKSPVQAQQPPVQNMRLAFTSDGTAIYKPVSTVTSSTYQSDSTEDRVGSNGGGENSAAEDGSAHVPFVSHGLNISMEEQMKRKREQLSKIGPDGTMDLGLSPVTTASAVSPVCGGFSSPLTGSENPASSHSLKKARGRPPGSRNKQKMAPIGSVGTGFTAHVITVKTGEDVSSNIMSFLQCGSRAVCVLSANGAISNVTLRQPATFGGTVTYEGRFEILSLSGSFLLTENGGQRSRTGGLSVSLAGPDGRVLGGGVAGILTAASPVQVVIGSFDGPKESNSANGSGTTTAFRLPFGGATGASSPHSHGTLSESSGGPGSPVNHSSGACNSVNQHSMTHMQWK